MRQYTSSICIVTVVVLIIFLCILTHLLRHSPTPPQYNSCDMQTEQVNEATQVSGKPHTHLFRIHCHTYCIDFFLCIRIHLLTHVTHTNTTAVRMQIEQVNEAIQVSGKPHTPVPYTLSQLLY